MNVTAQTIATPHAVAIQPHSAAIERVNLTFFLAARDAARDNVQYAVTAFGVPPTLGQWLATASVDEVMALAKLPVCAFAVRVPPRALERACGQHPGRAGIKDGDCAAVVGLHTVLKAVEGERYEHA
ncbi:hypothetical protein [uncultured Lamprocystis sp.]|jgi:hypothetical protein|uniref:hypothetical protein n=1 Tax=uncultured Lamprocystis sp. TaxID=543132 RepID=UPI0025E54484|nr:hypothetical protein [uncultured Lamprocystis sp.]